MFFNYERMKSDATKVYDQAMREIDMWQKIENNLIESKEKGLPQMAITTEFRIWDEVGGFLNKVSNLAFHYGYTVFKIDRNSTSFVIWIKKSNS